MIKTSDIIWLSGLLEGEGCFYSYRSGYPAVSLNMTDKDIVERAAKFMGATTISENVPKAKNWNITYSFSLGGSKAVSWMMTLYILMGKRRQEKIEKVIIEWKNYRTITSILKEANGG